VKTAVHGTYALFLIFLWGHNNIMSDIIHDVIRLIKQSPNGYVQLCQLKQKYREKYARRDLCQRRLKKWVDKIPDLYIDDHPVNDSIHVRETHEAQEGNENENNNNINNKKKRQKKKKNGDGVNDLCFAFARTKAKAKKKKAIPIRNDCYYGMANQTVKSKDGDSKGRRCIMHFGFTSSGKTFRPENKFKTKEQGLYKSKTSFSRAIVSGYMANKIKNSCGQKAARKARNLARLRKKYNPRPAVLTAHALQRYKERGKHSSPIYKPAGKKIGVVIATYCLFSVKFTLIQKGLP
jgi:hypothetical protein